MTYQRGIGAHVSVERHPIRSMIALFNFSTALLILGYGLLVGQQPPVPIVFVEAVLIILFCSAQVLRLRRESRIEGVAQLLPRWVSRSIVIAAVAGACLMAVGLARAMPANTPSGKQTTHFLAEEIEGRCRFTYNNGSETSFRPIADCRSEERDVALIPGGCFLLFASVGLWMAYLRKAG